MRRKCGNVGYCPNSMKEKMLMEVSESNDEFCVVAVLWVRAQQVRTTSETSVTYL